MFDARVVLTLIFRNCVSAFLAAVNRPTGAASKVAVTDSQLRVADVVICSGFSYIHMRSFLFLEIKQGIELNEVGSGPQAVVLGVGKNVGGSDAAFQ